MVREDMVSLKKQEQQLQSTETAWTLLPISGLSALVRSGRPDLHTLSGDDKPSLTMSAARYEKPRNRA